MLSGADVLGCASFEDSIGVNGWPMESHVAGDVIFEFPPIPESRGYNELPYRMLVPEGIDNLLAAIGIEGRRLLERIPAFVPHPRIAQHAHAVGLPAVTTAAGGDAGVIAGLLEWFAAHPIVKKG